MAASTSDFISTLNNLIETCRDGEQGFREAAGGIQNTELQQVFRRYAEQRAEFARELSDAVRKIGGDPENSGSVSGAMHRGWINLKAAVTGKDDAAILNEAERGEDVAKDAYQKALAEDLPSDIRAIVETQYRQVKEAHDRVRDLQLMHTGR
jgi:uncharacterized protein (TIGR02284 family)